MKRSSGEGSIQKRKDGRWQASVMVDRKRHYVYGATRSEVVEKLKELKQQHERGRDISKKTVTIEAFLNQWFDEVGKVTLKPRTFHRYEEIKTKYLIPKLGSYKLTELNAQHVQRFINDLIKTTYTRGKTTKRLAPRTVRNIRNVLRRVLSTALQWRLIEHNAAQPIVVPKVEQKKPEALEPAQVAKFFKTIKGHPREPLYMMAIMLGLREGELLGLRKEDVNLERRELHIDGQIQWIDGKLQRVPTKTEASKRTVTIPEKLVTLLERALAEQMECSLLFPSRVGTPINPRNLIRQFKELLTKAGLPDTIRFHDLRHTAASYALANGLDVKTTMEMLGHSQASTTLNIYAHVLKENRRDAVNVAVNKAFGNVVIDEEPQ